MKKKFLLFLICVAIVATSLIALVACADDKKQDGTEEGETPGPPAVVYANPTEFLTAFLASDGITLKVFEDPENPFTGSLNAKGEFVDGDMIAKYSDNDLWMYNLSNGVWVKAKIDSNNKKFKELLDECKSNFYEQPIGISKMKFVEKEDKYWYPIDEDGEVNADAALKIEGNTLNMYVIEEGEKFLFQQLIIGAEINLPKDAESAKVVDAGEILGYEHPYDAFKAFFASDNYAITVADDWSRYFINSKGEFQAKDIYGIYDGDTLWGYNEQYQLKSELKINGNNHKNQIKAVKDMKETLNTYGDLSKENFIEKEGYWNVVSLNKTIVLSERDIKIYDGTNADIKDGRYVYSIELNADVKFRGDPDRYNLATEAELFEVSNPFDYFNVLSEAKNFSITLNNALEYSINSKGEFAMVGLSGMYEGNEFWVYADDGRKAKVDIKGQNYMAVMASIEVIRQSMCLQNADAKEDFISLGDGMWTSKDKKNTYKIHDRAMDVRTETGDFGFSLRDEIRPIGDTDDYEIVTEEELFAK